MNILKPESLVFIIWLHDAMRGERDSRRLDQANVFVSLTEFFLPSLWSCSTPFPGEKLGGPSAHYNNDGLPISRAHRKSALILLFNHEAPPLPSLGKGVKPRPLRRIISGRLAVGEKNHVRTSRGSSKWLHG